MDTTLRNRPAGELFARKRRESGRLERGSDGGGVRYFLCGRPVSCGTGLEMRLPGDTAAAIGLRQLTRNVTDGAHRHMLEQMAEDLAERWVHVRYESEGDHCPVLYLALGGAWESWTPPPGKHEGDEIQVDCRYCGGRCRFEVGDTCSDCGGKGARKHCYVRPPYDRGLEKCEDCNGTGRVLEAHDCCMCGPGGKTWQEVVRPGAPSTTIRDLASVELRWPGAR